MAQKQTKVSWIDRNQKQHIVELHSFVYTPSDLKAVIIVDRKFVMVSYQEIEVV